MKPNQWVISSPTGPAFIRLRDKTGPTLDFDLSDGIYRSLIFYETANIDFTELPNNWTPA